MDINQAKNLIKSLPTHIAVNLRGQPGIGKTYGVQQVAAETGARCYIFLCCTMDPVDLSGLPMRTKEGYTEFSPPRWAFELSTEYPDYNGPAIAFFDDLPTADESVQASFFRMVHERCVGRFKFRDNVRIIAAGNRSSDKAATREMPTPLRNRFLHIDVDINTDNWIKWGIKQEMFPPILGFIEKMPNKLNTFNPKSNDYSFATPRSWHLLSDCYKALGGNSYDHTEVAMGLIGAGVAIEFETFLKHTVNMKSPKEILAKPEDIELPDKKDIDILYATTSALSVYVSQFPTSKNIINAFKYAIRLTTEFGVILAGHIQQVQLDPEKITDEDERFTILSSDAHNKMAEKFHKYLT